MITGQVKRRRPAHRADGGSSEVVEFLRSLSDRGASINTVEAYRTDLEQLGEFLKSRRQATGWKRLDKAAIEKFVDNLKSSGYQDSSVVRKLVAVRSFFAFLAEEGTVRMNPAKDFRHPMPMKVSTRTLTPDEAERLLALVGERSTAAGKRDRAMLELLYATGMRVSELVSLDIRDLRLDSPGPYVVCPSKAGKKRAIPIGDETVAAIREYLKLGRPEMVHDAKEQSLFVSQRGTRLTRQGFWLVLKGYARAANLANVSSQTFRAAFVRRALGSGMTVGNVRAMLGHLPGPTPSLTHRVAEA